MREKHPNTFQIVASSLKDREKRTYYLYPDAGLKHKEEKNGEKQLRMLVKEHLNKNIILIIVVVVAAAAAVMVKMMMKKKKWRLVMVIMIKIIIIIAAQMMKKKMKRKYVSTTAIEKTTTSSKRKKQLEAEKLLLEKEELQEEEEDDDESEESDNEENVNVEEINTKTPIKKLVYYMENNLNDHDIHSSCLSVLREHCIYLDDDDLRMSQKRIWMNIVECIFNAIRRFRRNETNIC